jgi:hypothetical protein
LGWFSIYVTATGELKAHTSILPEQIDPAWTVIDHGETRQDQDNLWNVATRTWTPRPAPIVIDRLQDLANHPYAADIWTRLTVAQRTKLRKLFVWLLGTRRLRGQTEPICVDEPDGWPTDPAAVTE